MQVQGDADGALLGFQRALGADPRDCLCWEQLADTYGTLGKFTAATRALTRSIELEPMSLQCVMTYDSTLL